MSISCTISISCRAPHGARGLKQDVRDIGLRYRGRAPHGARGLKPVCTAGVYAGLRSRPAWGAWIETRTPPARRCKAQTSRPAWGAWIETSLSRNASACNSMSRPAWGAWIETLYRCFYGAYSWSRPAWGAWIETVMLPGICHAPEVAPHTGRVD